MENPESPRTTLALIRLAENGANAAQIADAIVSIWQEIAGALTPIIGLRGFAMLYKRSLYLTISHHSWLADAHDSVPTFMDLSTLESVLAQQDRTESAVAGGALLHTFYDLLTSLVGPSLTETLLRSIWANAASDSPTAQDTAP
ncbi:hypothetical protein [Novilysobacter erysipheiresistens]|uniref:Uncharacterized protein n=1 Tax=Novilysobacter erysipheiresistens TaxID=1749332 RepID=A0ABU7YX46_9GAMM